MKTQIKDLTEASFESKGMFSFFEDYVKDDKDLSELFIDFSIEEDIEVEQHNEENTIGFTYVIENKLITIIEAGVSKMVGYDVDFDDQYYTIEGL